MKNEHERPRIKDNGLTGEMRPTPRLTEGMVLCDPINTGYQGKRLEKKPRGFPLEITPDASETRTPLTLDLFTPRTGTEQLRKYAIEDGLIPNESPNVGVLKKNIKEKPPEYFMGGVGERIMDRANESVYATLAERFGLDSQGEAERFYGDILKTANEQVLGLVNSFCPEEINNLGLKNQVERISSPAKMIRLLEDPKTDPRIVHELTRQASIGILAAELDLQTKEIKKTLDKVEEWFEIDLFDNGPEGTQTQIRYALHDNETNEAVHVNGVANPNPVDYDAVHLKAHRQEVKRVKGENAAVIGWVLHDTRMKKTGPNKAVYKAMDRETTDATLQATKDVPDMIGMKLIAEDAVAADALIVRVTDILKNRFGLSDDAFRRKDTTRGAQEQSGGFRVRGRLMVKLPGCPVELELMIHTQQEELHNTYEVGELDPGTGKPTGAAHKLMEVGRAEKVLRRFFPPEIYPGIDWDEKKKQNYEDIIRQLKRENRVDHKKIDPTEVDGTIAEYIKARTNTTIVVDFANFEKTWRE